MSNVVPVSYTHLDVYKRQVLCKREITYSVSARACGCSPLLSHVLDITYSMYVVARSRMQLSATYVCKNAARLRALP